MMVTDTSGHHLVNRENIEKRASLHSPLTRMTFSKFVSSPESQATSGVQDRRYSFKQSMEWRQKNYDNLGDAAKLKPLEVELKRLEDLSESIVQDFAFMRRREEEMRDTNE